MGESDASDEPVLELRPEVVKTEVKNTARSGQGFKEINMAEVSSIAIQLDRGAPQAQSDEIFVAHVDAAAATTGLDPFETSAPSQSEPELIILASEPSDDAMKTQLLPSPLSPSTAAAKAASSRTPTSAPHAPHAGSQGFAPEVTQFAPPPGNTQVMRSPVVNLRGFENLSVKPTRTRKAARLPLKVQDRASLSNASDPLAMALKKLFDNGAISALVLQTGSNESLAVLAYEAGPRKAAWEGLKWNPTTISPALWTEIQKSGVLELPPMLPALPSGGRAAMPANPRSVLRRGLGAERSEWLTLLAMESKALGKAVLVVFSKSSIQATLPQVKPWLKPAVVAGVNSAA